MSLITCVAKALTTLSIGDFKTSTRKYKSWLTVSKMKSSSSCDVQACQELGFRSTNLDLIYGLPKKQTQALFAETLKQVLENEKPGRLSVLQLPHMPQLFAAQRKLKKMKTYLSRKKMLSYKIPLGQRARATSLLVWITLLYLKTS